MHRERVLKVVLVLVGLLFFLSVYPLITTLWPRWQPHHEYEQMMLAIYATLGIFLLLASRNPSANRSLIAFTVWSSLAHAAVMAVQAFHLASERGELLGGVILFVIVGVALLVFTPAKQSTQRASAVGTQ